MRDQAPSRRYELLEPLGQGGCGEVWRARDTLSGREVVVKRSRRPDDPEDPSAAELLAAEFALVAPLAHPGIARALDFVPPRGEEPAFLVLELIEGTASAAACREASAETLFGWAVSVLETLSFLHGEGLIHGDLKPENIVVSRAGRPHLIDFGLAGRPGRRDGGSVGYAAPESLERGVADERSDLYALGATLFSWLYGRPPFGHELAARLGTLRRRPALPSAPPLPRAARELLRSLLAPDPVDRPGSARVAVERMAAAGFALPFPELADPAARARALPLAGREAALEALDRPCAARGGGFFAVTGAPGAGASRVLDEVARRARLAGRQILGSRGAEIWRALDSASPAVALGTLAERGPVTLIVDDGDALDPAGRTAILELPWRLVRERDVAVVVAFRSLPPGSGFLEVALAPLDAAAARRLTESLLPGPPISTTLAERLARAGGGRPGALVTALVRAVEQRLVLAGHAGWDKSRLETAPLDTLAPPTDPHPGIATLAPAARALLAALDAAAVPGSLDPVPALSVVAGGAGLAPAEAAASARSLVGAGLARRASSGPLSLTEAGHAAARQLPPDERAEVHAGLLAFHARERFDAGLAPLARASRLARLARHAAGAGRGSLAGPVALAAVRSALAAGRPEIACAIVAGLPAGEAAGAARAWFDEAAGEAELVAGRPATAAERLASAARCHREAGRSSAAAWAEARWARAIGDLAEAGAPARALAAFEGARRETRLPRLAALVRIEEGIFRARRGQYAAALELLDEALRLAPRGSVVETRARAARGRCLVLTDRVREGEAELDRALPAARRARDAALTAAILSARIQAALFDARPRQVLDLAPELRRLLVSRGDPDALAMLFGVVSDAARALGQFDQALAAARAAVRWREVHGHRRWTGAAHRRVASILLLLGDLDAAARALRGAIALARSDGDADDLVLAFALAARLAAIRRDAPRAQRAAVRAADAAAAAGTPRIELEAAIAAAWAARAGAGGSSAAAIERALREPVERMRREGADPPGLAEALALLAGASAASDPVPAARLARRAQASAERRGDFEAAMLALDALERALSASGDAAAAARARGVARARLAEAAAGLAGAEQERRFLGRPDRSERLESEAPTDRRRLEALYEVVAELNSRRTPGEVLETLLDRALSVLGAERGAVVLERDSGLEVACARQIEPETRADALRLSRTVLDHARGGESLLVPDTVSDPRLSGATSVRLFAIRAVLCVPLRHKETTAGALYLDSRDPSHRFDRHDLEFLEALAHHAALALENARAFARLARENERLRADLQRGFGIGAMVGRSAALARLAQAIEAAAPTGLPVLVTGESGSGKELVARALHGLGSCPEGPFVAVNCAAVPESILEATLFGHARGAFTGADRARPGLLALASGGTLFLDEIGDMPRAMQAKLLRALEEQEVRPVGAPDPVPLDFRLVAATHRDLGTEVKAGRFRADLLFRIDVLRLAVPPLRERIEDLPLLTAHLLERLAEPGAPPLVATQGLLTRLATWEWPGNVRELENVLARLSLHASRGRIGEGALAAEPDLAVRFGMPPAVGGTPASLDRAEREAIRRALLVSRGNRERAARLLGIGRATIFRKIRQLGLEEVGREPGASPGVSE